MKPSTKLLRWYKKEQRDLPWRKTKDPYKILVSEIMLQQTQVDRVIGFYDAWLQKFPDFTSLAKASNADVIKLWSGLGYNRRALALRDIAKQVESGSLPQNREEWIKLKGIGPYTSAAIALFSLHERVFPVDSIIRRVMGRFILGVPFSDMKQDEKIEQAGLVLLQESNQYWDIPQAIFDLGTKICTKKPDCSSCPLQKECKSAKQFLSGTVTIPKRSIKKAKERIHAGKKYPDRIYRGKLLQSIKESNNGLSKQVLQQVEELGFNEKIDQKWFDHLLIRLEKDGLIEKKKGKYYLPE